MDKCLESISFKITPTIKHEWDQLSEEQKKKAKTLVMDTLTRYLHAILHYDAAHYFGGE